MDKKRKRLTGIVILCMLGVLSIISAIVKYNNVQKIEKAKAEVQREETEESREKEIKLLEQYFVENTKYRFEKIPPSMSFALNERFRELTRPDYFLFREETDNVISMKNGYYVYIFSSRETGINMMSRLKEEGIHNYCLISRTLFYAFTEEDVVLEEARKYFEEN